jgi:penicillin-binding protein 1C
LPRSRLRPLLALIPLAVVTLVVLAALLDGLCPPAVPADLETSVEVLDAAGGRLRLYTTSDGYWRLPVHPADLDPRYLRMLLDYEDHRFYQHPGVDPLAIVRALGQALLHGHFVSGGSTLTMQTVRLLEPRPRTLTSKLIEVLRALQLEWHLSKDRILSLYLTLAPYGGNIQGVRAASLLYFGKEPAFLTLAEAALLVALPQSPEARRPDRAPSRARQARDAVLARLAAAGLVSSADAALATTRPVPRRRLPTPFFAPHLADRLRAAHPGRDTLRTTLDGILQRQVEALLAREQGREARGVTLAALVLDNQSGEVRAYVGSADYFATRFPGQLDMVRAVRSPGSTLKPFVYGLALEAGLIHPETLIFDRPGPVDGYAPGNFDHRYQGEIHIREALWGSRNIPAIKVLDRLGPETLTRRLAAAGAHLHFPAQVARPGLPVALGGVGISLEDLTRLYAGLAEGGRMRAWRVLRGKDGEPSGATARLLSPAAAWYVTDILAESPPPEGFVAGHRQVAFKTGTSYGFRDAWAIGYDAGHTVGIWLGRPDNGYTAGLSGLRSAVPVLLEVLDLLPRAGLAPLLRERPAGVLVARNGDLPPALRHFDAPSVPPLVHATAGEGPRILYPPAGVLVEVGGAACPVLHLETRGGQPPFHLLVDGRPVASVEDRQALTWMPDRDGAVCLTVLDARGRADRVRLRVRRLEGRR